MVRERATGQGNFDGVTIDVGEEFNYKGKSFYRGQKRTPPAHPRCRCAVCYVEAELDNGAESDIMETARRSDGKSITPIMDNAIARVPKVDISGCTNEQCQYIQKQHKELLRYSRDNNAGKEVAFVFDKGLTKRVAFKGESDRLDFGNGFYGMGSDLLVMHNHPSNGGFSTTDILFLIDNDYLKTLTIVKNNGAVESITKNANYDKSKIITEFKRQYKLSVKSDSVAEVNKFVKRFLNKSVEWLIWQKK